MRRILAVLALCVLIFALSTTAFALTGASAQQNTATVSADGSCHVSVSLTLHLEQPLKKAYFPVPANATGISLNGSRVFPGKNGDARQINISRYTKNMVGDISLNIQYNLYGVVKETEIGTLELGVPLLSGFEYPVENLSFTVALPGQIQTLPAFTSGYHQANIEQDLTFDVEGNTITGNSLKAMKDHETLVMTLLVDKQMFPQVLVETESTSVANTGLVICGLLALGYWLLTLRTFPWRRRNTELPDGYTAGQVGAILGSAGSDLTLMVFSWAQLGYLAMQSQRGRVTLYKRMDMGNERSEFERRVFKKLFAGRNVVDTTAMHYASLRESLQGKPGGIGELMHKRTGSTRIFRGIAALMGVFAGGGIGMLMGSGAALQWLLIVVFGILGGLSGWVMQDWTDGMLFHNKEKAVLSGVVAGVWLLLGLSAGNTALAGWFVFYTAVAGVLFAIGGRRTEVGRYTRSQVLGLRHHLRGGDKEFFKRMQTTDPDYFFRMAPYAMALGVGKPFAKAMGGAKLEGCSYFAAGNELAMSATGWMKLFEQTLAGMDARSKGLPLEKLVKFLKNLKRYIRN